MREKCDYAPGPFRSGTLLWAVAVTLAASAAATATEAQDRNPFNFASFCGAVEVPVLENHPAREEVLYRYQTMLYEAAGVSPHESLELAYQNSKAFLDANAPSLVCNTLNFNPRNGNIYKLAVARQADGFIDDALNNWHVDLNQIDLADGKTVLDYIADRRTTAGPTYARTLDRYYTRFRAAGARHASELR